MRKIRFGLGVSLAIAVAACTQAPPTTTPVTAPSAAPTAERPAGQGGGGGGAVPTATPTASVAPPSPTPSATASPTAAPSATPTPDDDDDPSPTPTPSPSATGPDGRWACPTLDAEHALGPADYNPRTVFLAEEGEHLVVVEHDDGLVARFLDPSGAPVGEPLQVDTNNRSAGALAYDHDLNQVLVVYNDTISTIKGRLIDVRQRTMGPEFTIATDTAIYPRVVYHSAAREFMVVYEDAPPDAAWNESTAIMGRRISATGEVVGAPFIIARNEVPTGVAYSQENQEVFVVGNDLDSMDGQAREILIRGHRLRNTGEVIAGDLPLSDGSWQDRGGHLVYNAVDNEFLMISARAQDEREMRGQRVSIDGTRVGAPFTLAVPPQADQTLGLSGVAHSVRSNLYLVSWTVLRHETQPENTMTIPAGVMAGLFETNGRPYCAPFTLSEGDNHMGGDVALNDREGFLAVYQGPDLKGRMIRMADQGTGQ